MYLAVVAAQSVATLGSLGQGALVTAGSPLFGTLLKDKQESALSCFSSDLMQIVCDFYVTHYPLTQV